MTFLRQRMIEDMQVRNLAPHTQATYVEQVSRFARYFAKSPEMLGEQEIRAYQLYLTNHKKLAPSSIMVAVAALRFLYKVTLKKPRRYLVWVGGARRLREPGSAGMELHHAWVRR
jgi:site-specific recombinase XerD